MITRIAIAPTIMPVSLNEIKDHLRISIEDLENDSLLTAYLNTGVDIVQARTGRVLITQTWDAIFESWQAFLWDDVANKQPRILPFGNIQSVTHIKYQDEDNTAQTVSTDYYRLAYANTDNARVVMVADSDDNAFDYPDLYEYEFGRITVRYVCGYGDSTAVPGAIKSAIKLIVSDLFDSEDNSLAIDNLLTGYSLRAM